MVENKSLYVFLYLQWTTIGPAEGGFVILTLRMKESSPVAWYGTPWSGQPVKWNCLTSRTSLKPRWVGEKRHLYIRFHGAVMYSVIEYDSNLSRTYREEINTSSIRQVTHTLGARILVFNNNINHCLNRNENKTTEILCKCRLNTCYSPSPAWMCGPHIQQEVQLPQTSLWSLRTPLHHQANTYST